jgi:hypothetical protein
LDIWMNEKKYIDPRVALGRAKLLSENLPERASTKLFQALLTRLRPRWRAGMTGRDAYKYMQQVEQLLIRHNVFSFGLARQPGHTIVRGFYEQRRTEGGVSLIYLECSSLLPPPMVLVLPVEVTAHALQRAFQRIGTMDSAVLRVNLLRAFLTFPLVRPIIEEGQWRQFGLVIEEGIFVGSYDDSTYRIRTFLPATDNGRPSAWREIHALLWQNFSEWNRSDIKGGPAPSIQFDELFASLADHYPFLLEAHEPKNDPLDEAWAARPTP